MSHSARRVRLSFAGGLGEPPTLIDLTFEFDDGPAVHFVPEQTTTEDIESFLQWTLENDQTGPRDVITEAALNAAAPVQVYQKKMIIGSEDDKTCVICCEEFRPRKHVRRLPCNHLFCAKCIVKWATQQSATCPTCRTKLT